jgi:rfaE bifunctional protein nucleotidyltransferase chain/domain
MSQILQAIEKKIVGLEEFLGLREALKKQGEKVVFTNGCFDILHLGHVQYLAQASELGQHLVVALNSDDSVRRQNKGADRPINPEHARAQVLASLSFVDSVVLFGDDTPKALIEAIRPDVLVKGSDYDETETNPNSKKYIVGSQEVKSWGGEVRTIPLVPNFSTTAILNRRK